VLERFLKYSEALADSAQSDPDVLGLVLVGSTADTSRVDEWSDHDFFWIVKEGLGEKYRQDLSWIPEIEKAVITPRETAHGLKVVFEDARVLEFAVFEEAELDLAALNAYTVPVDKKDISQRCEQIRRRSEPAAFDWKKEAQLFLSLILIGVGRYRRGEVLIAGQFIRSYSLEKFLGLAKEFVEKADSGQVSEDNLNCFRRFDFLYPELATEIDASLRLDVESAARWQLSKAKEFLPSDADLENAILVIEKRFGWFD
jgi:hypothetical protein